MAAVLQWSDKELTPELGEEIIIEDSPMSDFKDWETLKHGKGIHLTAFWICQSPSTIS